MAVFIAVFMLRNQFYINQKVTQEYNREEFTKQLDKVNPKGKEILKQFYMKKDGKYIIIDSLKNKDLKDANEMIKKLK